MKYANYIILFVLLSLALLFKEYIHVSTNLLSLFASKEAVEKLDIANNLGFSKEMFVAVKGFDNDSKTKITEIAKKLQTVKCINQVQYSIIPSEEIQTYYKKYYPILFTFNDTNQTQETIRVQLKNIYDTQLTSIFYAPVDRNDPLKLFEMPIKQGAVPSQKGGYITLDNYGFLLRISTDVSPSQMNEAKLLYKDVQEVLSLYPDTIAFAPFFYTVENSEKIQSDVQLIVAISTIILLLIYYLLIKNIRLLSHTLVALFSSMVFAALVSTIIFTNFNVLSLAFGMSITAVSIDYLLHYHFHNFYQNKNRIDKNVLFGFLTTTAAFGIFSFIPIPIISQISFFAVLSLSFAYLLFTFVFPFLQIKEYEEKKEVLGYKIASRKMPSFIFFIVSVLLFLYSGLNMKLDSNIRNLDYQNTKLREIEEIFKNSNQNRYHPVIVQSVSKDGLIKNLNILQEDMPDTFSLASFVRDTQKCQQVKNKLLHYDFNRLNKIINNEASKIGYRDNYFKDAYTFTKDLSLCSTPDLEIFKTYNLSVYEHKNKYYSIAFLGDIQSAQKFDFVTNLDVKQMFEKVAKEMYSNIVLYSLAVLSLIIVLLILSVKKRFIYALNYILFPSSVVLALLVTFTTLNIMHIFSLIILIAIGIDYGIYMSNTDKKFNTILAIKYSLFSTFAAFGVLIFSTITALNSIGVVITLGLLAIFILIKGMK